METKRLSLEQVCCASKTLPRRRKAVNTKLNALLSPLHLHHLPQLANTFGSSSSEKTKGSPEPRPSKTESTAHLDSRNESTRRVMKNVSFEALLICWSPRELQLPWWERCWKSANTHLRQEAAINININRQFERQRNWDEKSSTHIPYTEVAAEGLSWKKKWEKQSKDNY